MNGGLSSALEYIGPEQIRSAVAGFRYFGLEGAARALVDAFDPAFPAGPIAPPEARGAQIDALDRSVHERLEQFDDSYNAAVLHDDALEAAFRERLRQSPGDFAPQD